MRIAKLMITMVLVLGFACPAMALFDNKFEQEVEKEAGAVKLVREVERGGYDVVATEELKNWIDSGKEMVIVDTMPFEASYKKAHIPGAQLIPLSDLADSLNELDPAKPVIVY